MNNIHGDIDIAIRNLILTLVQSGSYFSDANPKIKLFASKLISQWDHDRGNDWYTSTKKWEEI